MLSEKCPSCNKNKPTLTCQCCEASICKSCAEFQEPEQFEVLTVIPEPLKMTTFCKSCYIHHVEPLLNEFELKMASAREILVFDIKQGKETRLIPRLEKTVSVQNCNDYDQTLLKLAMFAVEKNMNALLDVDIKSQKIKDGRYTTTLFSGTAVPAKVEERRLVKDRSIWQNPN